jgi:hypothetical protein
MVNSKLVESWVEGWKVVGRLEGWKVEGWKVEGWKVCKYNL